VTAAASSILVESPARIVPGATSGRYTTGVCCHHSVKRLCKAVYSNTKEERTKRAWQENIGGNSDHNSTGMMFLIPGHACKHRIEKLFTPTRLPFLGTAYQLYSWHEVDTSKVDSTQRSGKREAETHLEALDASTSGGKPDPGQRAHRRAPSPIQSRLRACARSCSAAVDVGLAWMEHIHHIALQLC
jgi:hypothetical protein